MTDPPDIPALAITAAAVAIHDVDCPDDRCSGSALGHCYRLARAALEAAEPVWPHLVPVGAHPPETLGETYAAEFGRGPQAAPSARECP